MEKLTFHLISNAHLDPVWLWDWREGLNEGVRTCRCMVNLLEEYPFFRFSRGESCIYEHIASIDPVLFRKISGYVSSGRWDLVGGNVVQPDQNMPDTATLVRQFRLGKAYFRRVFNCNVKTAWSADCFGHSCGIPEILHASGFENFCFSRPQSGLYQLPDDLFYWEGAGGSRILCCRISVGWYGCNRGDVRTLLDKSLVHYGESRRRNIALGMGLGDHGGGTTRRQIHDALAWAKEHPEVEVRFSTFHDYFKAVRQEMVDGLPVETVHGELNYCLRGCYSSQAAFKHQFRLASAGVRRCERSETAIDAALGSSPKSFDNEWNCLSFNSFHDILPGTSIESSLRFQEDWLGSALHSSRVREFRAVNELATTVAVRVPEVREDLPEAVPYVVFNPRPRAWRGYIELEGCLDYRPLADVVPGSDVIEVLDGVGHVMWHQKLTHEHRFYAENLWRQRVLCPLELPAFGWQVVSLGYVSQARHGVAPGGMGASGCDGHGIGNGMMEIRGDIGSSYLEILHDGKPFAGDGRLSFGLYEDEWGAWGDSSEQEDGITVRTLTEEWSIQDLKVLEEGPERASLWVRFGGERSWIELTLRVCRGSLKISCSARLVWLERSRRLKLRLPGGERVIYDVPGGEISREVSGLVPGVRYALVLGKSGYSFATNGGYGYDHGEGHFSFTVARGSRYSASMKTPADAFPEDAVERGELVFDFMLGLDERLGPELADDLEFPPIVVTSWPHEGERRSTGSLLQSLPSGVELVTMERGHDGKVMGLVQNRAGYEMTVDTAQGRTTLEPWKLCWISLKSSEAR